uniref:TNFR-Cys domain-containing protein n=1 Tax=Electrophorus electricus TaxID=8005 RepID=A0A4W4GWL6_ELEEL
MNYRHGLNSPGHLCLAGNRFRTCKLLAEERRACKEQEYRHQDGNCVACRQCDAGQELSKECGFGFGEEAHCVPCRAGRFKPDGGLQKCKPCLHCTMLHRLQKANCSSTRNAVCGDCLPGFYRKTKLSGFQDMECIPCGDPPPPYEPHCSGRVNLVPVPSTVTSPRDMALAAVICGALATVLLALVVLCIIYCKRQLLEKKPTLLRTPDSPFSGEELSCLHRRQVLDVSQHACCRCRHGAGPPCGPMQLIPSLCCEDLYRESHKHSPFQSLRSLSGRYDVVTAIPDTTRRLANEKTAATKESPQRCGPPSAERSSLKKEQEEEVDHGSGLLRSEAVLATPDGDATTGGKSSKTPQNEIHLCQFCTPLTPLEVQRWCRSFEGWAALINVSESSRLTGFERRVDCENS